MYRIRSQYVTQNNKYISSISGKRCYGVEFEMELLDLEEEEDYYINDILPKEIGICEDGSLREDYGIEIQTPIMSGSKARNLIHKICNVVSRIAEVNNSCGLHVHIDARDLFSEQYTEVDRTRIISNIWLFYIVYEDVILSMLPKTRRRNHYCERFKSNYHISEIVNAKDEGEIEHIWYRTVTEEQRAEKKGNKYDRTRYAGINLHSLFRDMNIEIRYHSGTLNPEKIIYWAELHTTIIDKIIKKEINNYLVVNDYLTLEEKIQSFFYLLKLDKKMEMYLRNRIAKFSTLSTNQEPCAE